MRKGHRNTRRSAALHTLLDSAPRPAGRCEMCGRALSCGNVPTKRAHARRTRDCASRAAASSQRAPAAGASHI